MPDRRLYDDDAALDRVETRVIAAGLEQGRPWVRLEETIFYPEGGGQPADRGTIAGIPVLHVESRGSEILHFLEKPVCEGPALALLDAARRFDFRQQHTAQHLLTALLQDRHGRPTTSFHLGESVTAIEIEGAVPPRDALARWEEEVNDAIRRNAAVRTRFVDPGALDGIPVRTRGLPEGHSGALRLVEIEGLDRNTCGGTHVSSLAEIQIVHLLDAEPARGGARLRFLAGGRVLRELRRLGELEDDLKRRIGTSSQEFGQVLEGWHAERKRLERRARDLERTVAEGVAQELRARPHARLARIVPGASPELLRSIASLVLEKRPEAVVVLLGASRGSGGEVSFLVQAGASGPEDVAAIGEDLRRALAGKGGGRGRLFQGRAASLPSDDLLLSLGLG